MYDFSRSYWVYVAWTFGVIIFLVNIFQLYVMFKDPKVRKSKSMVLIFNLTLSDVLFSLLLITHTSLEYHWENKVQKEDFGTSWETSILYNKDSVHFDNSTSWGKQEIFWYTKNFFSRLTYRFSTMVSLLTHIFITCDRLYCVLRPIKYWQHKSRKYLMITASLTWVIPVITSGTIHALYRAYVKDHASYTYLKKFDVILANSVPVTFCLLLILMYGFIQWKFKRNNTKMTNVEAITKTTTPQLPSTRNINNHHNCRKKQERIFMKMSFAITSSFCFCWMPICTYNLLGSAVERNEILWRLLGTLIFFNPILNCIFYFPVTRRLVFRTFSKLRWWG